MERCVVNMCWYAMEEVLGVGVVCGKSFFRVVIDVVMVLGVLAIAGGVCAVVLYRREMVQVVLWL